MPRPYCLHSTVLLAQICLSDILMFLLDAQYFDVDGDAQVCRLFYFHVDDFLFPPQEPQGRAKLYFAMRNDFESHGLTYSISYDNESKGPITAISINLKLKIMEYFLLGKSGKKSARR